MNAMQAPAPRTGELVVSVGRSRTDTEWKPQQLPWDSFLERLERPVTTRETQAEWDQMSRDQRSNIKDVGGFVGGLLRDGVRKADSVLFRQMITLDADYATPSFWQDFVVLNDYEAALYTTHSHRPEAPRYRLLIPLTRPVRGDEYEAIARRIAQDIGIDQFDDTTYEVNRLMFWPSVSCNGEYIYKHQEGDWLDPDEVLGRYHNWHDRAEWPVSSRTVDALRASAEKQGDPLEKPGIIGAFNRVYTISSAIDAFLSDVYAPAGEGRYTHIGGSTTAGAKVFDSDLFLYSWHANDPYHGRLMNAFDLVRLHLYGELDGELDRDTTMNELPSYARMKQLCREEAAVMDELRKRQGEESEDGDIAHKRFLNMYADQDIARLIAGKHEKQLMYHESLGWIWWTGTHWQTDSLSEAITCLMRTNNRLLEEARENVQLACDDEERKRAQKVLSKVEALRSNGRIQGVAKLLQVELPLKDPDALDPDPWMINTPDCLIDMRTGERKAHDPGQMCSKITSVTPEAGPHPLWDKFLNDATMGDSELAEYLQLVAGMAAVGRVYEEGLVIVYGPGGNGKSTMFGTLQAVMGDYACTIRSSILIERNGAEPYGMEAVRGCRMALMGELDEGARMSVSVMKSLTSRDEVQANPKYMKPFTFNPTHKLILHTNHLPRLGQMDGGTLRRIAVVPFVCPPKSDKERIADLSERLVREEGKQIMQWIIDGARKFFDLGCSVPKPRAVVKATEAYIKAEDWMGHFIDECCLIGEKQSCSGGALYQRYVEWAKLNNEYCRRARDFTAELEKRGYEKRKTMKSNLWTGIGIAEEEV